MVLQLLVQRRRASDDEGPQQGTLRDKLPDPCFLTLKCRGEMLAEPVLRAGGKDTWLRSCGLHVL